MSDLGDSAVFSILRFLLFDFIYTFINKLFINAAITSQYKHTVAHTLSYVIEHILKLLVCDAAQTPQQLAATWA